MKKLKVFVAAISLLFLLFITANAAPNDKPTVDENLYQSGQIIRPKAGISWHEQVDKQRSILRRGAEKRNAAKRDALMGKKENMENATIDSYNAMIMKKNAEKSKQQ